MAISVIFILIGFVLLIKGADLLVEGASNIAKKFHIPEIIIGLTIISVGTSMPELFVSITSAINGHSDMAVGNIVGSNLSNLFLILGLSSIIRPIQFKKETRLIEIPICLFTTIVFVVLGNMGADISRKEGMILIGLFILFIIYTIVMASKAEKFDKSLVIELSLIEREESYTLRDICYVILGIAALKFGGGFTVDNAVKIAQLFNWSEKLIGVTILAVGTSLPELVTSVTACLFLNAGNVTKNGFDFSFCAYITKEKDQLLRKGKLQTGDVVLTTRGTVGNVAFLNETMTFSPMRINSGMVILRNLGVVSPEYIYTALRHESLQKTMMMYASGSAQPQLPIKDMRRIKIIKADAKTMDKFTKYVADIYKQVSLIIMKNQAISKQRDLLLPRLMSGKLEV